MPLIPAHNRLRIARANRELILAWAEGVHLEAVTGISLADLRQLVTSDRIQLAAAFATQGDRLMTATPAHFRDATSRFYYSMYHSMRAAVFFDHGGDDNQAHSELPRHTPRTFPDRDIWSNRLKSAREHRNSADYDPYPKSDMAWRGVATELQGHAHDLLRESRAFLRGVGCVLR